MRDVEQRKGMLAIAACALLWSTGGLFIKLVDWHPMAIAGMRSLIAGLVLVAFLKKPQFTFAPAQILAALAHSATMILFVAATRSTTAANAILLQYTAPVYVALIGWVLLKEKPSPHHWAALAAVIFGMVLFFKDELEPGYLIGNIMALASGVTFALFSLFMRMQKNGSPMESMLLSNALTFLIGIPFFRAAPAPDLTGWMSLAALGLFQTGLSLVMFTRGIVRITALSAMLIAALEPLLNPVWVFFFAGERPGLWSVVGGLVILVAVTLSSVFTALKPGRWWRYGRFVQHGNKSIN